MKRNTLNNESNTESRKNLEQKSIFQLGTMTHRGINNI